MSNGLLNIYHSLPAPARSVVASARGFYLRRWRYGPETERLVKKALERDYWTDSQWAQWRNERLSFILHRAATQVPFYRRHWENRRRRGDRSSWQDLGNWPILDKEALRQEPRLFLADDCQPKSMFEEHTSGSTGKPLTLWCSRDTLRQWYALFETRWRRWYGVSREDRWANLGGQLVVPFGRQHPPFWIWNAAMHQLYMSSYHLSPTLMPHYLDALEKYRVKYLYGYTSSLLAVAQEAIRRDWQNSQISVAITNAEPLLAHQRETIEQAFGCPVRETYGMSELAAAAGECEYGRLHTWPEAGIIEVVDGDEPAAPGTPGDLVCTGLLNTDMPLIRYRLGDRGCRPAVESPCDCGRTLPCLDYLEGRTNDVLLTCDGRRVGRLDPVFKSDLPIREAQIIQQSLDRVCVKLVPASDYTEDTGQVIVEQLRLRLGDVHIDLQCVDEIPRGPNGKLRFVVSELPAELRDAATDASAVKFVKETQP